MTATLNVDCYGNGYRWDLQAVTDQQPDAEFQLADTGDKALYSGTGINLYNGDQEIIKHIEYPHFSAEFYTFSPDKNLGLHRPLHRTPWPDPESSYRHPLSRPSGRVWDVSTPENPTLVSSMEIGYWGLPSYFEYRYTEGQFTKDNQTLITCVNDYQIRFWDTSSGKLLSTIPGKADFQLSADETQAGNPGCRGENHHLEYLE